MLFILLKSEYIVPSYRFYFKTRNGFKVSMRLNLVYNEGIQKIGKTGGQ